MALKGVLAISKTTFRHDDSLDGITRFRSCLFVVMNKKKSIKNNNKTLKYMIHTSLVAQMVENLSALRETWVLSLGWEDPLEKRMATHSSILAWVIHGQRCLTGYSTWGREELDITDQITLISSIHQ